MVLWKLKGDFRYTPESVFDTFPWPQKPKHEDIKAVAEAAVTLRALRQETMRKLNYSLPPRAIFRLVFLVSLAAACNAFVWIAADSRHG